ncbi:hypothetical protein RSAG8_13975, partial [Rhizoctonia solani AG-8 WAC10335]
MSDYIPSPSIAISDSSASNTTQVPVSAHIMAPEPSSSSPPKRKRPSDALTSEADTRQQKIRARIEALEVILDAAESVPPTLEAPDTTSSVNQAPKLSPASDVYWHMAPASSRDDIPVDQIEAQIKKDEERQVSIPIEAAQHIDSSFYRCVPCL